MHQEHSKGIKDLGGRQPLYLKKQRATATANRGRSSGQRSYLGSRGTLRKTLYEIFGLKIAKQIVGTTNRMRKMTDCILWMGQPPPKRKKRLNTEQEPDM
jgi:hypothetical protein